MRRGCVGEGRVAATVFISAIGMFPLDSVKDSFKELVAVSVNCMERKALVRVTSLKKGDSNSPKVFRIPKDLAEKWKGVKYAVVETREDGSFILKPLKTELVVKLTPSPSGTVVRLAKPLREKYADVAALLLVETEEGLLAKPVTV